MLKSKYDGCYCRKILMTHVPNKYDVITDLRRCLSSSYSDDLFEDKNVKVFLNKAEENLEFIKKDLEIKTYLEIKKRLEKAKDSEKDLNKRREDLLTASCLLY